MITDKGKELKETEEFTLLITPLFLQYNTRAKLESMQSLYVCSDIHGNFKHFNDFVTLAGDNPIAILGDFCPDSFEFSQLLKQMKNTMTLVRGNCDISYDFSMVGIPVPPMINSLSFDKRTIILTHGHYYKSPSMIPVTLHKGDIYLSGHTHKETLFIDNKGIIIGNPGSLTYPRGECGPSYMIIKKTRILIKELYGSTVKSLTLPQIL